MHHAYIWHDDHFPRSRIVFFCASAGLNNTLCQAPESASHAASNHHHAAARAIHDEYKKKSEWNKNPSEMQAATALEWDFLFSSFYSFWWKRWKSTRRADESISFADHELIVMAIKREKWVEVPTGHMFHSTHLVFFHISHLNTLQ